MSTERFNDNILRAARRLGDARTYADSSDDTNRRFSSARLSLHQNNAIRNIVEQCFKTLAGGFGELVPEYLRTSDNNIPITGGYIVKPADLNHVIEVYFTDGSYKFHRVPASQVIDVVAGKHGTILPTLTNPYYYEYLDRIYVLPSAIATAVSIRYVKNHDDITVSVGVADTGKYLSTAPGAFVYSTKELTATMSSVFTSDDVNRKFMMRGRLKPAGATSKIYNGYIQRFVSTKKVILAGDGLPTSDEILDVYEFLVSYSGSTTDIELAKFWDDDIVNIMVANAINDKKLSL